MAFTGWRATALVLTALVVVALLLTALFWLAILIAALALVAWFNVFLLPSIAFRTRIPQVVLAAALLPIAAAAGLGLAGTGGLIGGCLVWVLGVALPRVVLWRMRSRFLERVGSDERRRTTRVLDTRFTSKNSSKTNDSKHPHLAGARPRKLRRVRFWRCSHEARQRRRARNLRIHRFGAAD